MSLSLYQGDFRQWLPELGHFRMLFADPPDNIGWSYDGYVDKLTPENYYDLIRDTLYLGTKHSDVFWMSFNVNHMEMVGSILYSYDFCEYDTRWIIQHVTFGVNLQKDFSRCFRPMVRLKKKEVELYVDHVRIPSDRQEKYNDKRANPRGKIPPDVWTISRVCGTFKQKRKWHSTQLHEDLYQRVLQSSAKPGDRVGDLYAGSGTLARVAKENYDVHLIELSEVYCNYLSKEHEVSIKRYEE